MSDKMKKLTINAVMIAMCAVLGYTSLDFGSLKITFESLPILLSAFLFGPVDGMIGNGNLYLPDAPLRIFGNHTYMDAAICGMRPYGRYMGKEIRF